MCVCTRKVVCVCMSGWYIIKIPEIYQWQNGPLQYQVSAEVE